jgi:hypothetical protein
MSSIFRLKNFRIIFKKLISVDMFKNHLLPILLSFSFFACSSQGNENVTRTEPVKLTLEEANRLARSSFTLYAGGISQ